MKMKGGYKICCFILRDGSLLWCLDRNRGHLSLMGRVVWSRCMLATGNSTYISVCVCVQHQG